MMKIKFLSKYILSLWGALAVLLLAGCSASDEELMAGDDDVHKGEMRIAFRIADGNGDALHTTTRAQLKGTSYQDFVTSIYLLCFDRYGVFVGKREAEITSSTTSGQFDTGTFTANVPEVTARVHFVANYEPKIGNDEIQQREEALMLSAKMATAYNETANTGCIYWGYEARENAEQMKEWLNPTSETHTVYLVRDRARVHIATIYENAGIKTLEWTVSNGRSHGFIAPLDRSKIGTSQNPFEGYYQLISQQNSGHAPTSGHSQYEGISKMNEYNLDQERFTAVAGDLKEWSSTNPDASDMFLYEDRNTTDAPVRIIFHVIYTDNTEKYHAILLTDTRQQQLEVLRNRAYILNIVALPKDMGVATFPEALTTNNFTNNQLVSVKEDVAKVSNGKAELEVNSGNTTKLFTQRPSDGMVTIPFTFKNPRGAAGSKGVVYDEVDDDGQITQQNKHVTSNDFTVSWDTENTDQGLFENQDLTVSYDWDTGTGTISFKIGQVSSNLKHGVLLFGDNIYGMQRKIQVYSITNFVLAATPTLTLVPGVTHQVGNSSIQNGLYTCDTWKLDLKLPYNFPEGLFPITLEMATSTLNPFSDTDANNLAGAYSVTLKSTSMLNQSNSTTDWNYKAKEWGYWYEYTKSQRPEGLADNAPIPITIYFNDIRKTRRETNGTGNTNRITNVGLYLRLENFKDGYGNDIFTIPGSN